MTFPLNETKHLVELTRTIFNPAVKNWKEKGKKVFGYFCSYIPEELLYAADVLPYRINPMGCTGTPNADVYMTDINCTFARSCLEFLLRGEFHFLDGMVSMNSCDSMRRIHDIWKSTKGFPFMHFLSVPYKISETTLTWYKNEIANLKKHLELYLGIEITSEKLKNAIEAYNETRALLRKLYELRQEERPPVAGGESLSLALASLVSPKSEYNKWLKAAIDEIEKRNGLSDYKTRLMIIGSVFDDLALVEILEDLKGLVCTDTTCMGGRYFQNPVASDGDLLLNLAKAYLSRPLCARISNEFTKKTAYVKEMIKHFRIDGVIYQRLRYCDPWGGDIVIYRKRIKDELGIPMLELEREYWLSGAGQLRTRLQAFQEVLETAMRTNVAEQ